VEAADGQELEFGVAKAINDFVLGCKNDGIWDAIKASCILAGARTLNGALVPLVGAAPTNVNFVSGDYNWKTGLVGDASTKYLDSNRNSSSDPNTSIHQSIYISTAHLSGAGVYIGAGQPGSPGAIHFGVNRVTDNFFARNRNGSANDISVAGGATGFAGASRGDSSLYSLRINSSSTSFAVTAEASVNLNHFIFDRNASNARLPTNARLAFYSIGESLDLAALDTRVSNLITAIGAAIP